MDQQLAYSRLDEAGEEHGAEWINRLHIHD
jgi:hypothetical protein